MTIEKQHRDAILRRLRHFALEGRIQIVGAIEAGSRSWGFSSSDSDYDVRFLYRRPISHYLGLDSIWTPDTLTSLTSPYDFHGWDIRKAAKLGVCSNPSLYEWAVSDINYYGTFRFSQLCDIIKTHYSLDTIARSYYHIARDHYQKYFKPLQAVNIKRLLYITRSLLAQQFIIENDSLPPIKLDTLKAQLPQPVLDDLDGILKQKYAGTEQTVVTIPPHLNNYITARLTYYDPNSLELRTSDHEKSYAAFNDWLLSTVRAGN